MVTEQSELVSMVLKLFLQVASELQSSQLTSSLPLNSPGLCLLAKSAMWVATTWMGKMTLMNSCEYKNCAKTKDRDTQKGPGSETNSFQQQPVETPTSGTWTRRLGSPKSLKISLVYTRPIMAFLMMMVHLALLQMY